MRNIVSLTLLAFASLAPTAAFAHPGPHRDDAAWSLLHAATNLDHLLALGAAVAVALVSAGLLALEPQR